jgi:hypothetical protein
MVQLVLLLVLRSFLPGDDLQEAASTAIRQTGRVCCVANLAGEEAVVQLNTGSGIVSVQYRQNDTRFADLPAETGQVFTLNGKQNVDTYYPFPVQLFGQPARKFRAARVENADLPFFGTVGIQATIGNPVFFEYPLRINLREGIVELMAQDDADGLANQVVSQHAVFLDRLPIVQGALPIFYGCWMTLDTGSNGCLTLNPELLERLCRAGQAAYLKESKFATPFGMSVVKMYCLRTFELGGIKFQNVVAIPSQRNSIGLGVLQHFDMVLDFTQDRVLFRPLDIDHSRSPVNASGLRVAFKGPDLLVVHEVEPDSPASRVGLVKDDRILDFAGIQPAKLWRHQIDEKLAQAGETIRLTIERDGVPTEIKLPLSRPFKYPPDWPPDIPDFDPDAVTEQPSSN